MPNSQKLPEVSRIGFITCNNEGLLSVIIMSVCYGEPMVSSQRILGEIVIRLEPELGDLEWVKENESLFKD